MQRHTAQDLLSSKNSALFEEIVALVSHSFINDPVSQWLFSGHTRDQYITLLPNYIRKILNLALISDASILTLNSKDDAADQGDKQDITESTESQIRVSSKSKISALAVLIPPHGNATFDSPTAAFRAGIFSLLFENGLGFTYRLLTQFLPGMHGMHSRMFPDSSTTYDNWHLLFLATHPESQGQGLGKQLILDIQKSVRENNIDAAKEAKTNGRQVNVFPLYLEASNFNAKRLYNRMGFEDRTAMQYGTLDEGETLRVSETKAVLGGRQYGMVWTPEIAV